jgi:lipoprotein-releasing system ATP-binding protein
MLRRKIGQTVSQVPNIIMADEPTGNLDTANTAIIFEIFSALALQGNTITAVTHDHDFAAKSNRIIEMIDGRIIQQE